MEESALFAVLFSSKQFFTWLILSRSVVEPGLEGMLTTDPSETIYICHSEASLH